MKQLILTGILTCSYLTLSAQTLTINEYGNATDISGTTYTHQLTQAEWNLHIVDFQVNNLSGSAQNWMITRYIVDQPVGWGNYFCWGVTGGIGECYDPSTDTYYESNPVSIPAGQSGLLSTYVTAPEGGCSHLRYYVSTDGINFVDSVDMEVCFNLGINDLTGLELTVGPNPAQSVVNIQSSNIGGGTLQVTDAMGRIVRTEEVQLPYALDVNGLDNGTYFLRLALDQTTVVQEKIVVRH